MSHVVRVDGATRLAEGESRVFSAERDGERVDGYVVRHRGALIAFRNRCPHWNVDLDLGFGAPYDAAAGLVFCRNHGALFRPDDGVCIAGPCAGQRLERFAVREVGDDVEIDLTAPR